MAYFDVASIIHLTLSGGAGAAGHVRAAGYRGGAHQLVVPTEACHRACHRRRVRETQRGRRPWGRQRRWGQ